MNEFSSSSFIWYSTKFLRTIGEIKELGWGATTENMMQDHWKPPGSELWRNSVSTAVQLLSFPPFLLKTQSSTVGFFQECPFWRAMTRII